MNYSSKELKIVILEHTRECLKKKLKEQECAKHDLTYYLERTSKKYICEAHCEDNGSWFGTREYVTAKDYIKWKNLVFASTKKCKTIKAEIKNMQRIINFLTNREKMLELERASELETRIAQLKKEKDFNYQMQPNNIKLAELLHGKLCRLNHTSKCNWFSESWEKPGLSKSTYLKEADEMLAKHSFEQVMSIVSLLKEA